MRIVLDPGNAAGLLWLWLPDRAVRLWVMRYQVLSTIPMVQSSSKLCSMRKSLMAEGETDKSFKMHNTYNIKHWASSYIITCEPEFWAWEWDQCGPNPDKRQPQTVPLHHVPIHLDISPLHILPSNRHNTPFWISQLWWIPAFCQPFHNPTLNEPPKSVVLTQAHGRVSSPSLS